MRTAVVVCVVLVAMHAAAAMAQGMVVLLPVFMILIMAVVSVHMTTAVSVAAMVVRVWVAHSSFLLKNQK